MQNKSILSVTPLAAAELVRLASFALTPGRMHIDLVEDSFGEGWLHIRMRPGDLKGVPIARIDGVTIYTQEHQVDQLCGLTLDYYSDLSGGGFLISSPVDSEGCSCGAGFKKLKI